VGVVEGRRRRFLVPEVVQTSAMDCGPAALVAMLAGFDLPASYGRLREACHTDVDGTSIDTIEDIAGLLGLDAVQVMTPVDHVALEAADLLPAIVVTRLADRFNHFMVAWRRVGRWVQVMDPAVGRRWIRVERFERDLFLHRFSVPVDAWLAWAHSPELLDVLRAQLGRVGVTGPAAAALIDPAVASGSWEAMAALDAAVRVVAEVAAGRHLKGAAALVERLAASPGSIPERYWFAWPGPAGDVELRGAVLVRVRGPDRDPVPVEQLSADVAAVVASGRPRPNREVLELLRTDGWLQPVLLLVAVAVAAIGTVTEGVLLRQVLDHPDVGVPVALVTLAAGLLVLELAIGVGTLRLGRKVELGLRRRLFGVLPRLPDAYLRTRPQSDMAERAHHVHQVHTLPEVGAIASGAAAQLACMVVGIAILDPGGWWLAVIAGVSAVAIPLLAVPSLAERDLRLRTQAGALAQFLVDALLGLVPLRAHAAEAAVRAEHGRQLDEWAAAGRSLFRAAVSADALSAAAGLTMTIALVATLPADRQDPGSLLLVAYWAVSLPVLGQVFALAVRRYPAIRSVTLRLVEPLAANQDGQDDTPGQPGAAGPAGIRFHGVQLVTAGHAVLEDVELTVAPGEHVAIVGPAGAGKSSLVGLLLGWQRPSAGMVLVDEQPLLGAHLTATRSTTAWVAPEVQLWNASVFRNVLYGNTVHDQIDVHRALSAAELDDVVAQLGDSPDRPLGEGGRLLSGGEGQRVRVARALLRSGVRLVILDEPFRGVDRASRARLLDRVRMHWAGVTLLLVTHDVSHAASFERVVVVDHGRIVETGVPRELTARADTVFRRMLDAEVANDSGVWSSADWTRHRLVDGRLG
jgi:ATP-binding cassette subfamily B protein